MKTKTIFAIGSAIAGCAFVCVNLAKTVRKCRNEVKDIDNMEAESLSSYEEELAEIQAKHDAEMEALEEMDKKNKAEHNRRMTEMKARYTEKVQKMEEIRKELLKNVDMRRFATPEEAKNLNERDAELRRELREIRM